MSKLFDRLNVFLQKVEKASYYREIVAMLMLKTQALQAESDELQEHIRESLGAETTAQFVREAQASGKELAEQFMQLAQLLESDTLENLFADMEVAEGALDKSRNHEAEAMYPWLLDIHAGQIPSEYESGPMGYPNDGTDSSEDDDLPTIGFGLWSGM